MATQITWVIEWMQCYPQAEGQTDVVFQVGWRCNGLLEQDNQSFFGTVYSTQAVTYTAGSPYTPYADLTEDQVLGWIWAAGVDKTATEAAVAAQLEALKNPPIVSPALPWAQA